MPIAALHIAPSLQFLRTVAVPLPVFPLNFAHLAFRGFSFGLLLAWDTEVPVIDSSLQHP